VCSWQPHSNTLEAVHMTVYKNKVKRYDIVLSDLDSKGFSSELDTVEIGTLKP